MTTDEARQNDESTEDRAEKTARLVPFMVAMVLFLTAVYLALTIVKFNSLEAELKAAEANATQTALTDVIRDNASTDFQVLSAMESRVLELRYRQANFALLARVWMRFMGYTTGMTLCFIGAAFIVGRLRDPVTTIEGKSAGITASLATSSPGIALAFLGTTLIIASMFATRKIDVRDVSVYLSEHTTSSDPPVITTERQRRPPGE